MKYEKLLKHNIKIHPRASKNGWSIEIERPNETIKSKRTYNSSKLLCQAMEKAIDYETERLKIINLFENSENNSTRNIAEQVNTSYDVTNTILNNYLKSKQKI